MTEEVWKPVVGFEGKYEASNRGRVRSLVAGRPRVFKHHVNSDGYQQVALGKRFTNIYVHSLVLEAFVGPRPEGYECDHINTVRDDNRLENLRWVTKGENRKNPITLERRRASARSRAVMCMDTGVRFPSIKAVARALNLSRGNIWEVCIGRRAHTGGFHFRFVEDAQ